MILDNPRQGNIAVGHQAGGDFMRADASLGWTRLSVSARKDDPVPLLVLSVRESLSFSVL